MNEEEFRTEDPKGEEMVKYAKHYDENELWEKLRKFGRKAGIKVTYAVLLLYYVLKNPATSGKDRAKIIGALGYFILPIDLIPDFIPVAGYTDDLAALTWGIYCVIKSITPEVKANAAAKLHEWFGDFDEHLLDLFFEKKKD
ncbi:MAG: DUF1232 domain-containing protein [Bacteroidales bacterium]|jgi:uncharacterized membrane protein YkvA (DUF1232 family)|nr:DUF1232 domain-containing protein [Bacteroidales bacterium]